MEYHCLKLQHFNELCPFSYAAIKFDGPYPSYPKAKPQCLNVCIQSRSAKLTWRLAS